MDQHIREQANALAQALQQSGEYQRYLEARELMMQNAHLYAVYEEYKRAQVQLQASILSGKRDEVLEKRLQHLTELLYFDEEAAAFLLAEYALQQTVGGVYRMLARAVELDTGYLEE